MVADALRLTNEDEPTTKAPNGVVHSANMTDPADWPDPARSNPCQNVYGFVIRSSNSGTSQRVSETLRVEYPREFLPSVLVGRLLFATQTVFAGGMLDVPREPHGITPHSLHAVSFKEPYRVSRNVIVHS